MIGKPGDSIHEIIDLELPNGATLHRFVNGGDQDYSAIYEGNDEIFSQVRSREPNMIAAYVMRMIEREKEKKRAASKLDDDDTFIHINVAKVVNGHTYRLNINLENWDMLNQNLCDNIRQGFEWTLARIDHED